MCDKIIEVTKSTSTKAVPAKSTTTKTVSTKSTFNSPFY